MARLLAIVAILAVAAAASVFTPAPNPDCWQYHSCYACTAAPSGVCGWDPTYSTCKQGTRLGPLDKTGWSGSWSFLADQCCSSLTSCTTCTTSSTASSCGWDINSNTCKSGTSSGPTSGYSYSWVFETACPSQCSQLSSCGACLNVAGCGWAHDLHMCIAGSSTGYSSSWYTNTCPSNWSVRWSPNSYGLWCVLGGVGFVLLCASVAAGRRRRRLLMQQRRQQTVAAPQAHAQPTVGAPLLNSAAEAYPGQLVYGQPLPTPYYGAAPDGEYTPITADGKTPA